MRVAFVAGGVAVLIMIAVACWFHADDRPAPHDERDQGQEPIAADAAPAVVTHLAPAREAMATEPPPAEPIPLDRCDRDLDLFGVVVDASSAPLSGVAITTCSYPWRRTTILNEKGWSENRPGPSTISSVDGSFAVRLTRGAAVYLTARKVGFASVVVGDCQAGERLRLTLPPPAVLELTVSDEAGAPVDGACIRAFRRGGLDGNDDRHAVSAEDGRIVLDDLAPGTLQFRIDCDGLAGSGWRTTDIVSGINALAVTLATGRTIRGRVTDAATGRALSDARVGLWRSGKSVACDEAGRFEFAGWTAQGGRILTAQAEGFGAIDLEVPETGYLDFALPAGDVLRGRIVDASHTGVAGAPLTAIASFMMGRQVIDSLSTTTAEDGTFLLTSLRHDMAHTLVVQAQGYGRTLLDFDPHPGEAGTIDLGEIVLPEARSIAGIARGSAGDPLEGVEIVLAGCNSDRSRLRHDATGGQPPSDWYGRSETRRTDDLGRFRFPDQSPGTYTLLLRQDGRPEVKSEIVLPPNQDVTDVVMQALAGSELRLRVVHESGEPAAGVWMSLSHPSYVSVESDAEGRVVFGSLPDQPIPVTIAPPDGFITDPIVGQPGDDEMSVVLHPMASIEGVILDASGTPLPDLVLGVVRDDVVYLQLASDSSGRFSIHAKVGETMDVMIQGRALKTAGRGTKIEPTAYRGELRGVVAPASGLVLVAREVPLTAALAVRVVDPDGSPIESAIVTVVSAGGTLKSERTDREGRARLEGLAPETLEVRASPGNVGAGFIGSERLHVEPDRDEVTLMLRRGAEVAVLVVDAAGSPVPGASVTLRASAGQGWLQGTTNELGRFRSFHEPNARFSAEATKLLADRRTHRGTAADILAGGGEITLRLD